MWVEILLRLCSCCRRSSSSSWGCELKCTATKQDQANIGHPLREDVSWNANVTYKLDHKSVILFVRMWVEILLLPYSSHDQACHPLREDVSWNISGLILNVWLGLSSSSWGCELKFRWWSTRHLREWGHPLRENVSWNDVGYGRVGASCRHPPREDVSWNLEEYGVNHRCSNMVLLVGRWIEISLIVFLSFARRSHYYTSFNLNIKLNYRNLRGNFHMCS